MSQQAAQNQQLTDLAKSTPVGRIISIVGSKAILLLSNQSSQAGDDSSLRVDIGSLLAIETTDSLVLALVSGVSVPMPDDKNLGEEISIAEMELMGELPKKGMNDVEDFKRGVSVYPAIGDFAFKAGGDILLKAYNFQDQSAVRIGTLLFDKNIPAFIKPDSLLGSHFAILGATGTGKSCSVALLLRAILKKNPNAHIILLDPHSEYSRSFGSSAEVVTPRDLNMPFWLLNFEEIVEVLVGQNAKDGDEAEILSELIPLAKKRFFQNKGRDTKVNLKLDERNAGGFSVDTPIPYRMSDLLSLLEENIGKLDQRKDISPFKRLKAKIESISQDPRYSFMFGSLTVNDTMSDILGRLFRVPVNGKPICIFELTGFPSEVVTVVVSVLCRMTFDFGVWSDGNVPITLVCEEAHRYVPSDKSLGFEPVKRSISRIAKEGRKYGVSLGVVTQRPAEIDPTILAQCNTLFSLRMANDRDQEIVKAAISDSGASLLDILPSLGNGEAIVFGEGVALPARIKLDPLPPQALPKGQTAEFTHRWGRDVHDNGFLDEVVNRWRDQDINKPLAVKYSEELNAQQKPDIAQKPALQVKTPHVQNTVPKPAPAVEQPAQPQAVPQAQVIQDGGGAEPAPSPKPMMKPVTEQNQTLIQAAQKPQTPVTAEPAAMSPVPQPQANPQNAPAAQNQGQGHPAPQTLAPQTPAPQTLAPQTLASQTPAPQTPAQQATPPQGAIKPAQPPTPAQQAAPQAAMPPAEPQTPAPQTLASQTPVQQAPVSQAPVSQAPASPTPPQAPVAPAQKPAPQSNPAPSAAEGQLEGGYRSTEGGVEPPALQSGVNESPDGAMQAAPVPQGDPEDGTPVPGYQRLG